MNIEYQPEREQRVLANVSDSAYALFSSATTAEEVASLRDDLLQKVAQAANETRNRLKRDGQSGSID